MKNSLVLLRALLKSTSEVNIYKHTHDQKKRKQILFSGIGVLILYVFLLAYCILMCFGFSRLGLIDSMPGMCALIISGIAFMFTLIKTNGYLFNFKEYDMLMSLPFEAKTVAGCKFLYMYLSSLPWYISVSLAMMIGYGIFAHPSFLVYPIWLILSLILPIIPMLIASFFGFLIAKVSSGFRKSNIVQAAITIVFAVAIICLRFFLDRSVENEQLDAVIQTISDVVAGTVKFYPPAQWFTDAVTKFSLSSILLLVGISVLLFAVVFRIVGGSYRNINSALKSQHASGKYKMTEQKQHSAILAIAYKEFKRLTGSSTYMSNAAVGEVLAALLGILSLFIGFDKIIAAGSSNAILDTSIMEPAIPFVVYLFVCMQATTASSPSLEGKNYWIVQSLPIEKKTLYQGKMLFNMMLSVPFSVFATVCLCISAKTPIADAAAYIFLGIVLCALSTAWGCVCGIRHMRLDWENEVEVIKKGAAVMLYVLPNVILTIAVMIGAIFLGAMMPHYLAALLMSAVAGLLAVLFYFRSLSLAKKTF